MAPLVRHVLILAAGNGDRFHDGSKRSKLLTPVGGTPLLVRTLRSARAAGLTDAHIVVGYDQACVRAAAISGAPPGLSLHFSVNNDWHSENGVSVLATRGVLIDKAFALLMGDHLFEAAALTPLLRASRSPGEVLLGVDRHTSDPDVVAEATRVRIRDGRVSAIGKGIEPFDALDTGLFVCDGAVFAALDESCAEGDTTLSGGIRRIASKGNVIACDIGAAEWRDIDTLDDWRAAEKMTRLAAAS